jgi:hypothetical protein
MRKLFPATNWNFMTRVHLCSSPEYLAPDFSYWLLRLVCFSTSFWRMSRKPDFSCAAGKWSLIAYPTLGIFLFWYYTKILQMVVLKFSCSIILTLLSVSLLYPLVTMCFEWLFYPLAIWEISLWITHNFWILIFHTVSKKSLFILSVDLFKTLLTDTSFPKLLIFTWKLEYHWQQWQTHLFICKKSLISK